jgi:hypothetical protein
MKANFMFAIAALMLSQNVIAMPRRGENHLVPEVELAEPVEVRNETEVHKVEIPEGQEQVEVHHGRFRVRLNFKDHNSTSTVSESATPTETSVPTVMSSHRNRNRGGRS